MVDWHALAVAALAFVPEVESRGAVPVALLGYRMPVAAAVGWTLLGNLLGMLVAWPLLPWLARAMARVPPLGRALDWLVGHTRRRASPAVERWEAFGLFLFVGVPLPGTGAWAGVAAARVLGVPWRRAWLPLTGGTVVACLAVTLLVLTGKIVL